MVGGGWKIILQVVVLMDPGSPTTKLVTQLMREDCDILTQCSFELYLSEDGTTGGTVLPH